jgi:hypothetical protein
MLNSEKSYIMVRSEFGLYADIRAYTGTIYTPSFLCISKISVNYQF